MLVRIFAIPIRGMDMNRRHLIGGSAAGVAGALAMSPDAARAAPLTSTLGRDVTQYGVRPGSPDDQTAKLQRAIDEAARAQVPLALPPGVYRTGMLRLSKRHATGRRARRDETHIQRRRLDAAGRRRQQRRPDRHHLRRRRHSAAGAARPGALPRRARCPHRRLRNLRAAAATASGWSRFPATSPATSSGRSRPPRSYRSTRWA